MKLTVAPEKCQGHARCLAIAPELFAIDDVSGKSSVTVDPVPPELEERARHAVRNCPEAAIRARD